MTNTDVADQYVRHDPPGSAAPTDASPPTPWQKVLGIGLGLAALVGVLVTVFAWPAAESRPRDVPIALVGTPEASAQVEQQITAAMPGAFDVEPVPDMEAARELIRDREAYGAIVLEPSGTPRVLTASAASPAVAQLLQGVADRMTQQATGAPAAQVDDLVPLPDDDPRGAGFTAAALPMVIGGMIVGIAMSFLVAGVRRRVGGALLAAAAAGPVATLVVQPWLGSLESNYWANSAAITLTIAAISMTLIGLNALIGPPGIGLGALIMFLLGNSLSGVASAPDMLPTGWGTLGQLLPPGAGGTLLRSVSFFDGAAAGRPVLVLACWLAGGLLLAALGSRTRPGSHPALAR
jgi:hypothetical protein